MDVLLNSVDVGFCVMFLLWLLWDIFKKRRDFVNDYQFLERENQAFSTKITVLTNFIISISNLGFCLYEIWKNGYASIESVSTTISWCLSTTITVYSVNRITKSWPIILLLWWSFSTIFNLTTLIFYLLNIPTFLPKPNIITFISLPFSMLVCFMDITNRIEKRSEMTEPLLANQFKNNFGPGTDPFSDAGIWSKLTFRWLNPLFEKGNVQKLESEHIPEIPHSETANEASLLLEMSLRNQEIQFASLPKAILFAIWRPLAINAVIGGVTTIASYSGPLLITSFVNLLSKKDESFSWNHGMILALVFFFAKTVESLSQRLSSFGARRIGLRIQAALMVLIYKKSISIEYGGMSHRNITNLISVDVERIGEFFGYFNDIWLLPIQVSLALGILYKNLGAAPSMAALFTTVLVMICNIPLATIQKKLNSKIMEAKDSRIKATSEMLKSMRVLKLHSWESAFLEKLHERRETERGWIKRYLYTKSSVVFLFWASPILISVVTFSVCIILGKPLISGTVLSAVATFRILQEPIHNLPELISLITQTKVSADRIQSFILEKDQNRRICCLTPNTQDIAIHIEIGEYAWDARNPNVCIAQRTQIKKGYKVGICGAVGSGKTSFLSTLLGEIPRISGTGIQTYGSKAYVPQSAWIHTGSIRDNILFGKEINLEFYDKVVEACALTQDFQMWDDGDLSIVGERGTTLSGGQKQRIQMARAIYSNSDIYMLDDPFSAVDAHTGAHMFKKCLLEILHEKTVVYVTHQLEFLQDSDLVLVLKDGKIAESGKYQDLILNPEGELVQKMAAHSKSLDQMNPKKCLSLPKIKQTEPTEIKFVDLTRNGTESVSGQNPHEKTDSDRVKWNVYFTFITSAYKGALVPVILLCHVLFQVLQMASSYWIAWGSSESSSVSNVNLIKIFALLSGASSFFILVRATLLSTVAIETAQRLFLAMITSVFRAPLSFFDSTPSSQILNRSSTDQSKVDTDIPYRLAGLVFALIQLVSIVVLMSQVAWQVFLLFLVVFAISIWYLAYYIATERKLATNVPIKQATILHHLSETISGATIVRCFNQEDRFCTKDIDLIDEYSRVAFHNSAVMEWLCVRVNFLFDLVFFLVLIILVNLPKSAIDPSLGGLVATYGLSLNVLQAWVIWNLCNVGNKMISVERILQLSKIQSEAPLRIEDCKPPSEWPIYGKIEIQNLHVQYSPKLPTVLKGITCTFFNEKKIGIVGRTGSGKSTLIQAIFRVVEPLEGRILIDGINIVNIGLEDLRSRLSIIPQDPVLFQGTLRTNLDPLQEHSDQEIWEVIHKCRLSQNKNQRLLDEPVTEDGENWSLGQRQLVCLARALLQRRRILVLDEATASIDTETDNMIQKVIREETNGSTIITIAHRIPTIIDNDFVLVLGEGKVVEYDSPTQLLKDRNSAFTSLAEEFLRRSSTNGDYE